MLGPFATASRLTPTHQVSLPVLSRAACASMSTTTTTTTTTRDRGDRYGPMEWAQLANGINIEQGIRCSSGKLEAATCRLLTTDDDRLLLSLSNYPAGQRRSAMATFIITRSRSGISHHKSSVIRNNCVRFVTAVKATLVGGINRLLDIFEMNEIQLRNTHSIG